MAEGKVPQVFSRKAAAAKFARARDRQSSRGVSPFLTAAIAEDIIERLEFMRMTPGRALVIGDETNTISAWLSDYAGVGKVGLLGEFDEEQPGAEGAFDLIVHLMGLGQVNDLPGALLHARKGLADGGLFLAAFPGAGSLDTLRGIMLEAEEERPAARMHPLVDTRASASLLQRAGFSRQVVDSYPVRVRYSSIERLIGDLRDHGLTRSLAGSLPPLSRPAWQRALAAFDARRDEDGKVTEKFEILVLTGWC